jgi:hypothetical protein
LQHETARAKEAYRIDVPAACVAGFEQFFVIASKCQVFTMSTVNAKAQNMTGALSTESILISMESNWIQTKTVIRPLRIESPHAMCHVTVAAMCGSRSGLVKVSVLHSKNDTAADNGQLFNSFAP